MFKSFTAVSLVVLFALAAGCENLASPTSSPDYADMNIAQLQKALRKGKVVENSKEGFRQLLLNHFPDPDILLNKDRMPERQALAKDNALPTQVLMEVSSTYIGIAEKIIGTTLNVSDNPKAEIVSVLRDEFALVD